MNQEAGARNAAADIVGGWLAGRFPLAARTSNQGSPGLRLTVRLGASGTAAGTFRRLYRDNALSCGDPVLARPALSAAVIQATRLPWKTAALRAVSSTGMAPWPLTWLVP